jgi:2-dehydropantoate 2-reductase
MGALLSRSGREVTLVARGPHLSRLAADGLTLCEPDRRSTLRIPVVASPTEAPMTPETVVILGVKTQHALDALEQLRATAGSGVSVVCTQNGVESERIALRLFAHVYGMYTDFPADHLEPGVVTIKHAAPHGVLDVGEAAGGVDSTAESIAQDLRAAGFESRAASDIGRWKHGKLLTALGNAVKAICGQGPEYAAILAAARAEATACFQAAGISYAPNEEQEERRRPVPGHGGPQGAPGSGWQSLVRATGSIETDYINGEIVLLGRQHRIPVPVNALIQERATSLARRRGAPESLPLADFAAEVAKAKDAQLKAVNANQ